MITHFWCGVIVVLGLIGWAGMIFLIWALRQASSLPPLPESEELAKWKEAYYTTQEFLSWP